MVELKWRKENDPQAAEMRALYQRLTNLTAINSATVSRGKFRAFLVKRYKGPVSALICDIIDLTIPIKGDEYWSRMENVLNLETEKLKRLAFNIYDFGQDKQIDQVDLYALLKLYNQEDDQLFI